MKTSGGQVLICTYLMGTARVKGLLFYLVLSPVAERCAGVVDPDLMAAERRRGASLAAGRPRAVGQALRVHVLDGDARDGLRLVVGKDAGDGRVHDERDEEQKREHRHYGRRAEAQRRVKLGLLDQRGDPGGHHVCEVPLRPLDVHIVLTVGAGATHVRADDDGRLVRIHHGRPSKAILEKVSISEMSDANPSGPLPVQANREPLDHSAARAG